MKLLSTVIKNRYNNSMSDNKYGPGAPDPNQPPHEQPTQAMPPVDATQQHTQYPQTPGQYPPPYGQPQQPQPPIKPKKPWYKKWWIWVIIALLVIFIYGASQGGKDKTSNDKPAPAAQSSTVETGPTAEELAEQQSREAAEAAAKAEAEAAKKAEEEAAAKAEAEAKAAEEAARLDPATYTAISNRDWQLIEKDPAAHAGEKYVIYGRITQADAATGTSGFRADTSGEWQELWYDYDINTIVIADESIVKTVVTDDLVTMYVEVIGPFEYDTTIGGSMTAVSVLANIVEVTGTTD